LWLFGYAVLLAGHVLPIWETIPFRVLEFNEPDGLIASHLLATLLASQRKQLAYQHPKWNGLHDADAKRAEMLLVVMGYHPVTGACVTRYLHPDYLRGKRKRCLNDIRYLHDPCQFGLQTGGESHQVGDYERKAETHELV